MAKNDVGGKTRLKPMSIRVLFTFSNFVMFITGLQLLLVLGTIDWQKSLLAIVFATVIAIEIGLKRFTSLSSLKSLGLLQWIGLIIALSIFIFGILSFFNLVTITPLNQLVGAIFMISSLVTTFDIWF